MLIRERTRITAPLLDRLPKLQMISQRSVYPHIDIDACTRRGVVVSSNTHSDTPSYATAELTWALVLAAMRQVPQQVSALKAGQWQVGVGSTLRGKTLGIYGYGRIGRVVAGYGKRLAWTCSCGAASRLLRERAMTAVRLPRTRQSSSSAAMSFLSTCDWWPKPAASSRLRPCAHETDGTPCEYQPRRFIEPGALEAALRSGRPGMAAVDVYESEPLRE